MLAIGGSAVSALVGFGLRVAYELFRDKTKFRRELEDNSRIDLSGTDWWAAWQTSVDGKELLNTEQLSMKQHGGRVRIWNQAKSPENPKGGYLWDADMQFFHGRTLMGWYFPRPEEHNTARGIMFLAYQAPRRIFYGKWVGSSYDGDLSNGFVVIAKDRERALTELTRVTTTHKDRVNILTNFVS